MYMKKQCSKCKKQKNYSDFNKDKRTKDGLYSACKECHYDSQKRWRQASKEKTANYQKKWRQANKGKVANYRNYKKNWRQENKEHIRRYDKQRLGKNPKFRLDKNIGSIISTALKGKKAGRKWEELVGYTIEKLTKHLENQFDKKMSWNNYGNYWWLDHIKPRSAFKYETAEDPEFKKCWALKNLQPLEAMEN